MVDIIRRKRDGHELSADEIAYLVNGYLNGEVPEYQVTAWLMAVFFKGMSFEEVLALTDALVDSGERMDLSELETPAVDKHSTGGVGDTVTLVLGPVVAACGVAFAKLSGRGLGHTGGTVDKLESIPGFRTGLTHQEFVSQIRKTGICVAGQGAMAPADDGLYALRDVTATVESDPLVAASIMSKKIAGGAGAVVIDLKVGRGALFGNREQAVPAARLMESIGRARGVRVECVMTSMDQPLGNAAGNALEVLEAVKTLKGQGSADLAEVVIALAARLLTISGEEWEGPAAAAEARRVLEDGTALAKFSQWISSQGGDISFIDDPGSLELAPVTAHVKSESSGYVQSVDALAAGRAVQLLGAGRLRRDESVDHGVGGVFRARTGDGVSAGHVLATIYARDRAAAGEAVRRITAAYVVGAEPVTVKPLFIA